MMIVVVGIGIYFNGSLDIFGNRDLEEPQDQGDKPLESPEPAEDTPKPPVDMVEEPRQETITIAAVGDIIYHMSQIISAYNEEDDSYDFKKFFELIKPIIEEADLAIANYEGTTAGTSVEPYMAYPRFNAPDETLDALKYAGFNLISTINNHSLDMRGFGLIRTLEQLHKRGFKTVGTYSERPDSRVLYVNEKDIELAFIAYTYSLNGMEISITAEELDYMVNVIDRDRILEDILEAQAREVDMIIAIMHWGHEYQRNPSQEQRDLADFMFKNGVDIILGSHPHVIQDTQVVEYDGKKKFVIYSMGNFISNQREESLNQYYPNLDNFYTEDGVIVQIAITKNFEDNQTWISDLNFVPTWVNRYHHPPLYHYDVIPLPKYIEGNPLGLDEQTLSRMKRSYRDTMIKVDVTID